MSPSILLGRRTRAMRLVLAAVFVALVARLVAVQDFSHQHYAALSKSELTQQVSVPAVRGGIYDRSGEVLAESVTKQTVVADPLLITHPAPIADKLSPLLGLSADQLRAELTEHSGFVYLAHRVSDQVAAAVTKLDLPGINLVPESQRVEPDGLLAEPVVGSVGYDGSGSSGPRVPVPVDPRRQGGIRGPDAGARRRRPHRHHQRRGCLPPGQWPRTDPRPVDPVRRRAGTRRRDRRGSRHRRNGSGDGREVRGRPGDGRPDGHSAGHRGDTPVGDLADRLWSPRRTPSRRGSRKLRPTPR